jgi:hypothetical protein
MTKRMVAIINPRQFLGCWLKDHPHASHAHRVLRYDRELLVCYCGRTFPVGEAFAPVQGVSYCPECTTRSKKQDADKRNSHGIVKK